MSETRKKSTRPTLHDVAREAGVSIQSASHALTGNPNARLPQSTRDRIKEAAIKVGYRPNRLAQAIRYGRTSAVSVWLDLDRAVSTHLKLLRAFNKVAGGSEMDLIISNVDASAKSAKLPPLWPADGIIALDAYRMVELLRSDHSYDTIPVVLLGDITFVNSDAISWNTYGTAKKVIELMFEKGRTRVVHISPSSVVEVFEDDIRLRAYRTVMAERKLDPQIIVSEGDTSQDSKHAFLAYLDSGETPDGVFAYNDQVAIGVVLAAHERGLRVPEDIAVWGMGDHPESASFQIPISTTRMPMDAVVKLAWEMLSERIETTGIEPRRIVLDMEIIERASSG